MPQKFGPIKERQGTALYPGFGSTVPANAGRVQRLEKGSQRFQRNLIRPSSGNFARLPANILVQAGNPANQRLDLANINIHKVGSTPPNSLSGRFAYIAPAAGTSLIWYWDGTNGSTNIVVHRSDQSNFTVPGGSIAVTGLGTSTDYYFLPFWNVQAKAVGWVKGTVGSPQIAFVLADTTGVLSNSYIMAQSFQNLEALTGGFMTATTVSGGGGGGGAGAGGGGGLGHCVMEGTAIETLGGFSYGWDVYPEMDWIHLVAKDGDSLHCTVDHSLYHAKRGRVQAQELMAGDFVITDSGEQELILAQFVQKKANKHEIEMPVGHLYWANGFLSHNVKIGGLI